MKKIYLLAVLITAGFFGFSQLVPQVGFTSTITGLTAPVDIVNAKDGSNRLFVVQQNGIIRVQAGGSLLATPFLDISSLITYAPGGERGLLSLVFHPQYTTNGYFFVYYNNTAGNVELAQYHISGDPNVADPASRRILLTITKPFENHNGCKLNFGTDGNLYFGTGDGGSGGDPFNNAQNLNSLLGKMIRINVDNFTTAPYYTVPATNPLVGTPNTRPEIYSWGLRNPWRWNFDSQTGDMWIADVGQGAWEEVNWIPAAATNGLNYGWRCYEGTHSYDLSQCGTTPNAGKTYPIFEYGHNTAGGFSVSGGLVYRGAEYPILQGYYICADYVRPNGWLIKSNGTGGWTVLQQTNFPANVSTFGTAEDGTLYLASLSGGTIYKVTAAEIILPVKLLSFSGRNQNGQDMLNWKATVDPALSRFEIEQSDDGTRFITVGSQLSKMAGAEADYQFAVISPATGLHYYRMKMIYKDGNATYSGIVKIEGRVNQQVTAVYRSGQLQLYTPYLLKSVDVFSISGQKVVHYAGLQTGNHLLPVSNLNSGVYLVNCLADNGSRQQLKIVVQ